VKRGKTIEENIDELASKKKSHEFKEIAKDGSNVHIHQRYEKIPSIVYPKDVPLFNKV